MSDKIEEKIADVEETIDTSAETTENKISTIEDVYKRQEDLVNDNTEFAIQQIENQKADTTKEYEKEQANAYRDYMHATNPYGTNAEQMAASGLTNSGYSESAKVAMFNQYQNRLMAAREIYATAMRDWDMEITRARMQNRADLAEIAINAFKSTLSLGIDDVAGDGIFSDTVKESGETKTYEDVLSELNNSTEAGTGALKGAISGSTVGANKTFWDRFVNDRTKAEEWKSSEAKSVDMNSVKRAGLQNMSSEQIESIVTTTENAFQKVQNAQMTPEEFNALAKNNNLAVAFIDQNGVLSYVKISNLTDMINFKEYEKTGAKTSSQTGYGHAGGR